MLQIEEEILNSQEANRGVLAQLGQLQLYFDQDADYMNGLTSDRSAYGSRPATPVTDPAETLSADEREIIPEPASP